jgi:hypothetical protein
MFRDLLAVLVAVVTLVAASLPLTRMRRQRAVIKTDLEILALLPAGTEAHRRLSEHVQEAVLRALRDGEKRRDRPGMLIAVLDIPAGAIATVAGDGLWKVVGILGLVVGLLVAGISFPRFVRDSAGVPLWMLRSSRDDKG